MAKGNKSTVKEDVKIVKPNNEVIKVISDELKDKVDKVKIVKPEEKQEAPEVMVKVKLNTDHRCHIGGSWYSFKENTQYNVPKEVKDILNGAGLLKPL